MSGLDYRIQWGKALGRAVELPRSTRHVGQALVMHLDAHGVGSVGYDELERATGYQKRAVQQALSHLRGRGWLVTLQRGYRGRVSTYRALEPGLMAPGEVGGLTWHSPGIPVSPTELGRPGAPTSTDYGRPGAPTPRELGRPGAPTSTDYGRPGAPSDPTRGTPVPPSWREGGRESTSLPLSTTEATAPGADALRVWAHLPAAYNELSPEVRRQVHRVIEQALDGATADQLIARLQGTDGGSAMSPTLQPKYPAGLLKAHLRGAKPRQRPALVAVEDVVDVRRAPLPQVAWCGECESDDYRWVVAGTDDRGRERWAPCPRCGQRAVTYADGRL